MIDGERQIKFLETGKMGYKKTEPQTCVGKVRYNNLGIDGER
jgi:hypothetical protein